MKVSDDGYVSDISTLSDADKVEFAKKLLDHAQSSSIPADGTKTVAVGETSVEFNDLPWGYYLVDSSIGTLCFLNNATSTEVTITEKNKIPNVTKQVQEDSNDTWGTSNHADIGQTVTFRSTITVETGAKNYVYHDDLADGLTFVGITDVKYDASTVESSKYSVVTTGLEADCDFEVRFNQTLCDTFTTGKELVITYTALLNESAVVGGTGNTNTGKLSYGDTTKYTDSSITTTYTFGIPVFKYTGSDIPLAGAKFTLSKNPDGSSPIDFVSNGTNTYRVAKTGETPVTTEFTTDSTGKFSLNGLDADIYYLTETAAPDGYNKLTNPVKIEIDSDGILTVDSALGQTQAKVENKTGGLLPSTGGIGTTILYIIGGLLVIGAGVALVVRRRSNEK